MDQEVPAGTTYANGKPVKANTTNRELMREGQGPFVYVTTEDGQRILTQLELHHSTQVETQKGSKYFNGEERDGSLIEVPHYIHSKKTQILHIEKKKKRSFRVDDKTGGKSFDSAKYKKLREQYWKDRLKQLEQS